MPGTACTLATRAVHLYLCVAAVCHRIVPPRHRRDGTHGTCLSPPSAPGRTEPQRGPDSSPETCHSQVPQGEVFERAEKDRFWPRPRTAASSMRNAKSRGWASGSFGEIRRAGLGRTGEFVAFECSHSASGVDGAAMAILCTRSNRWPAARTRPPASVLSVDWSVRVRAAAPFAGVRGPALAVHATQRMQRVAETPRRPQAGASHAVDEAAGTTEAAVRLTGW